MQTSDKSESLKVYASSQLVELGHSKQINRYKGPNSKQIANALAPKHNATLGRINNEISQYQQHSWIKNKIKTWWKTANFYLIGLLNQSWEQNSHVLTKQTDSAMPTTDSVMPTTEQVPCQQLNKCHANNWTSTMQTTAQVPTTIVSSYCQLARFMCK